MVPREGASLCKTACHYSFQLQNCATGPPWTLTFKNYLPSLSQTSAFPFVPFISLLVHDCPVKKVFIECTVDAGPVLGIQIWAEEMLTLKEIVV